MIYLNGGANGIGGFLAALLAVDMGQAETEALAIDVARDTGLRAIDAWHIASIDVRQ